MTLYLSELKLSKLGSPLSISQALRAPEGAKAVMRKDLCHYLPNGPPASLFHEVPPFGGKG
jgi:hypothetical protein